MGFVIAEPCLDVVDKACVTECPVDCIYEGERMLYIHPGECVDCGACQPVCPTEAIYFDLELPKKWRPYIDATTEFFSELGSPGGSANVGKIGSDPDYIKNLPPRGDEE
jgi:NAD-dependent dihydropyrimidine dehydrogenase PreA subunit